MDAPLFKKFLLVLKDLPLTFSIKGLLHHSISMEEKWRHRQEFFYIT